MTGAKLGLLHTVPGLVPVFQEVIEEQFAAEEVDALHIADTRLLKTAVADPRDEPAFTHTVRTLKARIDALQAFDVAAILVTCSTLGPATDLVAKECDLPVVRIDRPMSEEAVAAGKRVAIVATHAANLKSSVGILEETARRLGAEVTVTERFCNGAFESLTNGDETAHDEAVAAAVNELAPSNDAIVLAQASMARVRSLLKGVSVPVLSSPAPAIASLLKAARA